MDLRLGGRTMSWVGAGAGRRGKQPTIRRKHMWMGLDVGLDCVWAWLICVAKQQQGQQSGEGFDLA